VMLRELFWCNYYDAQLRCGGNTAVCKVSDYGHGSPVVWGDTVVEGAAQWAYDVYFTGATLGDVEPLDESLRRDSAHACSTVAWRNASLVTVGYSRPAEATLTPGMERTDPAKIFCWWWCGGGCHLLKSETCFCLFVLALAWRAFGVRGYGPPAG